MLVPREVQRQPDTQSPSWPYRVTAPAFAQGSVQTTAVNSYGPQLHIGPAGYGSANFVAADTRFPTRSTSRTTHGHRPGPAGRHHRPARPQPRLEHASSSPASASATQHRRSRPAASTTQTTVPMTYNGQTFDVEIELGLHAGHRPGLRHFQSIDPNTELAARRADRLPAARGRHRPRHGLSQLHHPAQGRPAHRHRRSATSP